jgi:hypothetical protein
MPTFNTHAYARSSVLRLPGFKSAPLRFNHLIPIKRLLAFLPSTALSLCIVKADTMLVIKGSDTLGAKPVPQLAEAYKAAHPGVSFDIAAEGSTTGIAAIIDGTADIGMASRRAFDTEVSDAIAKGRNLKPTIVAYAGIARVAGETAPILFTAAYATSDKLPWEMDITPASLAPSLLGYLEYPFAWLHHIAFSGVNALPYHIYVVSSKIPQNEYTERVQYGTAFVFLDVVMAIALASVLLRSRLRNRLKW